MYSCVLTVRKLKLCTNGERLSAESETKNVSPAIWREQQPNAHLAASEAGNDMHSCAYVVNETGLLIIEKKKQNGDQSKKLSAIWVTLVSNEPAITSRP